MSSYRCQFVTHNFVTHEFVPHSAATFCISSPIVSLERKNLTQVELVGKRCCSGLQGVLQGTAGCCRILQYHELVYHDLMCHKLMCHELALSLMSTRTGIVVNVQKKDA